jgi:hypothetical protein
VKQWTPWLVCVFVPLIILDLQLAIYCDAPGYKVRTHNTEELADDWEKKQLSGHILFDDSLKSPQAIRRYVLKYVLEGNVDPHNLPVQSD